jgi:hypothetical protein
VRASLAGREMCFRGPYDMLLMSMLLLAICPNSMFTIATFSMLLWWWLRCPAKGPAT